MREREKPEAYEILESRMPELQERLEKVAKVAKKLGLAEPELLVVGEKVKPVIDEKTQIPTGRVRVYKLVRFTGEAPRLSGHVFVARVEHTEAGNIVSKAPGAEAVAIPPSVRKDGPTCDHCQTKRDRKDTFLLLREEDGKLIRVGRSCLQDYLRSEDVASVLKLWSLLYELESFAEAGWDEEGGGGGGGGGAYESLERYLAHVVKAIKVDGWVSRQTARDRNWSSTSDTASATCSRRPTGEAGGWWDERQPTEDDFAEARKVIEWGQSLTPSSDYEENLKVSLALAYVRPRNEGLVASAVPAYRKAMELDLERRKSAARPPSTYFGKAGSNYVRKLSLVREASFPGNYGTTYLYVLVDDDGRLFKWFASKKCYLLPEEKDAIKSGDEALFYFQVKGHEEYKGIAQTTITRAVARRLDSPAPLKFVDEATGEIFKTKKAMKEAQVSSEQIVERAVVKREPRRATFNDYDEGRAVYRYQTLGAVQRAGRFGRAVPADQMEASKQTHLTDSLFSDISPMCGLIDASFMYRTDEDLGHQEPTCEACFEIWRELREAGSLREVIFYREIKTGPRRAP